MLDDTDEEGILSQLTGSMTANLVLTAGALVGVSLAVLLIDEVTLWVLGSAEIQAKQTLVVAMFNLFLVVAYVGLVITNREQLSTMEDEVDLLRAEYSADVSAREFEFDGDEVAVTFRNRGPGIAFNPTLMTEVRSPSGVSDRVCCPVVISSDSEDNRVVENGSKVRRRFKVHMPTESGSESFSDAVKTYNSDWPSKFHFRAVYDTALGETDNKFQRELKFTPGASDTLEESQQAE